MSLPCAPASRRKQGEIPRALDRQPLRIERLVAVHADEGHLARTDEEQLVGRDRIGLLPPEREEAGARHRALAHHDGRRDELHAPIDERVHREAQDGHLEERAVADQGVRPPASEAAGAVPFDEPETGHQLDMIFGGEVELARLADALDLHVVLFAGADGHLGARDARHAQHQVLEAALHLGELGLELLDVVADLLPLFDELGPFFLARLGDQRRELVLARTPLLEERRRLATFLVGREQLVQVQIEALVADRSLHLIGVLADELDVEHRPSDSTSPGCRGDRDRGRRRYGARREGSF